MRIDAHQHFWLPEQIEIEWMQALTGEAARRLARPVLPAELEPILAQHGVGQTVLVQVATNHEEADFLLSLAERHPFIAGVVAWLDMAAPDFEERLVRLSAHPRFVGIRPMIENIADPGWLRRPAVRDAFRVLEERGVCFDFLIKHHQLPGALEVIDAHPRLRVVIDHVAKPLIAQGVQSPWREHMARAAEHSNVYCKLSGMVTEADHAHWTLDDLLPYTAHVLEQFGAERCMFGSDWPVCTLAASYEQVFGALRQNLSRLGLNEHEQARIFGGTAREFYRLA